MSKGKGRGRKRGLRKREGREGKGREGSEKRGRRGKVDKKEKEVGELTKEEEGIRRRQM